ncbi:reverse transcriptase family protein [Cupriavidus necator]
MAFWDSQLFEIDAPDSVDDAVIRAALENAEALIDSRLPPLFTLRHLAKNAEVPYSFLRDVVTRAPSANPYRVFRLGKSGVGGSRRFRWIAAPNPLLLQTQQWINREILAHLRQHVASYAYRTGRSAYDAAVLHKKARWLIKVDITNFFESIREPQVYKVFRTAGYQPLIAFELSRICTRTRARTGKERPTRDVATGDAQLAKYSLRAYRHELIGHLPQGAATSPTLANLIVYPLDEKLAALAKQHGFRYSRYADDIAFSSVRMDCSRSDANEVLQGIYSILIKQGYRPNLAKSRVRGPGARKLVLGLLVDGERPRLTKEFRGALKLHVKHLVESGPDAHAKARGFQSVIGLRHHVEGLIAYASRVDKAFSEDCRLRLQNVNWPIFNELDLSTLDF